MAKEENKETPPVAEPSVAPPVPIASQNDKDKVIDRKKTGGEKLFDRVVYTGIGFGVNEVSSLWITDQFMYGKNLLGKMPGFLKSAGYWFSKEGFDNISVKLADIFKIKNTTYKGEFIPRHARAGNTLLMVTLLSGGTLLLLPMRWLESNKAHWVQKANHWLDGGKLSAEEVAKRDAEVKEHIDSSPKQSWGSLLLGRLVACSASVGTGTLVGPANNKRLMAWSEQLLTGSTQLPGKRNMAHRWARLASVETYSCAISSIVLEIASKFFARSKPKPKDPQIRNMVKEREKATLTDGGATGGNEAPAMHTAAVEHRKAVAAAPALYADKLAAEQPSAQLQPSL